MEYIPTNIGKAESKYTGETAQNYDQKREGTPKWEIEQGIVEGMLDDLPPGSVILDAPCGTGRFFEFYHTKQFEVRALDKSADMLNLATQKVRDPLAFQIACSDIKETDLPNKSVDASVMVRLTRWISPEDCVLPLKELQRVTKGRIIFTARVKISPTQEMVQQGITVHPNERLLSLFESALDGWKISRNVPGHDEDYRIIMLEPG